MARRDPVWAEKMARRHAEFNAKRAALVAVSSPSSAAAVASEEKAAQRQAKFTAPIPAIATQVAAEVLAAVAAALQTARVGHHEGLNHAPTTTPAPTTSMADDHDLNRAPTTTSITIRSVAGNYDAAATSTSPTPPSVITACEVRDGNLAARPPITCSTDCPVRAAASSVSDLTLPAAPISSTTTRVVVPERFFFNSEPVTLISTPTSTLDVSGALSTTASSLTHGALSTSSLVPTTHVPTVVLVDSAPASVPAMAAAHKTCLRSVTASTCSTKCLGEDTSSTSTSTLSSQMVAPASSVFIPASLPGASTTSAMIDKIMGYGSTSDISVEHTTELILVSPVTCSTWYPDGTSTSEESSNNGAMLPQLDIFDLAASQLAESDSECSNSAIVLVPQVLDVIPVTTSADQNNDTPRDDQSLLGREVTELTYNSDFALTLKQAAVQPPVRRVMFRTLPRTLWSPIISEECISFAEKKPHLVMLAKTQSGLFSELHIVVMSNGTRSRPFAWPSFMCYRGERQSGLPKNQVFCKVGILTVSEGWSSAIERKPWPPPPSIHGSVPAQEQNVWLHYEIGMLLFEIDYSLTTWVGCHATGTSMESKHMGLTVEKVTSCGANKLDWMVSVPVHGCELVYGFHHELLWDPGGFYFSAWNWQWQMVLVNCNCLLGGVCSTGQWSPLKAVGIVSQEVAGDVRMTNNCPDEEERGITIIFPEVTTALRQALGRIRSVITVNKIDMCFLEVQVEAEEAYQTSFRVIKNAIVIMAPTEDVLIGNILVHVLCPTRPQAHILVSRPHGDSFSGVIVLGEVCIIIQPARDALYSQQANTTFFQASNCSRFIGYSSLSGSELLCWKISGPLDLVCSASGYKSGQLLRPTIVSFEGMASTVKFQFLSYVAIWSSRSTEFCQEKLSWDPGIWTALCFFGSFTQVEATGMRNVAAPACYRSHCLDHAYFFYKVCADHDYYLDVFPDQLHIGQDYYLGIFHEQVHVGFYLNPAKVCLDYNSHCNLGEVMKHQSTVGSRRVGMSSA